MNINSSEHGFTLIELVIVVLIATLLASVAVPSYYNMQDRGKLRQATEAILSDLHKAKSEAITRNSDFNFNITRTDADNWCYGLASSTTACDCTDPGSCMVNIAGTNIEHVVTNDDLPGVQLTTNQDDFEFSGDTSMVNAAGTIQLRTANNLHGTNVVVSLIGRIRACVPDGVSGSGLLGHGDC